MNYCEKCKIISSQNYCPLCLSDQLRTAEADDFCFLTEVNTMTGEMINKLFEENGISCVVMPNGNGVNSYLGLRLENSRIYICYKDLDKAKKIIEECFSDNKETLRKDLLDNINKFNALPKIEKKIRKNLRITENEDILAIMYNIVERANKIVDAGLISGCFKNGHYIFVYTDNEVVTVNSATYEIISAKSSQRNNF